MKMHGDNLLFTILACDKDYFLVVVNDKQLLHSKQFVYYKFSFLIITKFNDHDDSLRNTQERLKPGL